MASSEKLEDLNLTRDEIEKLTECMKQDEFKKLFFEYAEEISNPENRARYESEIRQLENERGMDVKFISPEPGYVLKTTIGGEVKAFINVCKNENVGKPSSVKKIGKDGRPGLSWTLPHSFTPPREDLDREKKKCRVFDFVVHPDTYRMAETNSRFKKMINDLALNGIRKQFDVEPDTKNVKFPKIKYKGTPTSTVIRSRLTDVSPAVNDDPSDIMSTFPYPYDNQTSEEKAKQRVEDYDRKHSTKVEERQKETKIHDENEKERDTDSDFAVPKYTITHRSEIDYQDYALDPDIRRKSTCPKALVVEVSLPLLSSAVPIQLDIFERKLKLISTKPAKYMLEIMLPYTVDENRGSARFDKVRRKLVVTLPVIPIATKTEPLINALCDGSGDGTVEQECEQDAKANNEADLVLNLPNQPTDRPLIEEISSTYSDDKQENNATIQATSEMRGVSSEKGDAHNETEQAEETRENSVFSITHLLPQFECSQTSQRVRFNFHVFKVCRDKISVTPMSPNAFQLNMVSVGQGGFPVHYGCYMSFDSNCNVLTDNLQLEVKMDKVILSLIKDPQSVGLWTKYSVGRDLASQETREFVNVSENNEDNAVSAEPNDNGVQRDSNTEVHSATCDHDINREESKLTADTTNITDCYADITLSVNGEISQWSNESLSSAYLDNVCISELDSVTESDTSSRHVTDQWHADSFTVHSNSDVAATASVSDSEINSTEDVEAESFSIDPNHDMTRNPESNKVLSDSSRPLVEEIDASDAEQPAVSASSKEASNSNDQLSRPNTMLSWSESPHVDDSYKSKCAVQFENSVIFDLDVE